jgi:hypothetical protein
VRHRLSGHARAAVSRVTARARPSDISKF